MTSPTEPDFTPVVAAFRRILRPLLRLLLNNGITLPSITEIVKQVLIEVAEQDYPVDGKRTTDSRISVLTGVHRKDVSRLRGASPGRENKPKTVSLGSKVINAWITDKCWTDADGQPLALRKLKHDDARPSFEELVESVSKDVRARAILDELLRIGVVELCDGDEVKLKETAFVPTAGFEEKLFYFERAAYSHLMAAVKNIEGVSPPFFERIVEYDTIPASAIPRLRQQLNEEGMALLQKVNRSAKRASRSSGDQPHHFTVGIYFYNEPNEQNDDSVK